MGIFRTESGAKKDFSWPFDYDELKLLYNINIGVWGFFFNTKLFKPMIVKKEYDILLYGCVHKKIYPLRNKIYKVLKLLKKKYKILIIPFYGYTKNIKSNQLKILLLKMIGKLGTN